MKKADKSRASGRNGVIKIWARRSTIMPQFVGLTFGVHNGQKFVPVLSCEKMVGPKLGEFAPTRTSYGHAGDKKARRGARRGIRSEERREGQAWIRTSTTRTAPY